MHALHNELHVEHMPFITKKPSGHEDKQLPFKRYFPVGQDKHFSNVHVKHCEAQGKQMELIDAKNPIGQASVQLKVVILFRV